MPITYFYGLIPLWVVGLAAAFEIEATLRSHWAPPADVTLAVEFFRRCEPAKAAQLVRTGALKSPEDVYSHLEGVSVEAARTLSSTNFLAPAVEALRSQCREDRRRFLPTCKGAFYLRQLGTSSSAICVADATEVTYKDGEIFHHLDFQLLAKYGRWDLKVVICASVQEVPAILAKVPGKPQLIALRYGDEEDSALSSSMAAAGATIYGHSVELRVKSSEYSVVLDDANTSATLEEQDGESEAGSDDLIRSSDSVKLTERQLQNLPSQVGRAILRSKRPLSYWKELTEDFPAYLKSLVSSKKPAKKLAAQLSATSKLRVERPLLSINGKSLPEEFSTSPFLHLIEEALSALVASEQEARGAAKKTEETLLDWRNAGLTWHYHVKKDEETEEWPTRLSALAKANDPFEFARFRRGENDDSSKWVRLPLVTIIVSFDVYDVGFLEVLLALLKPFPGKLTLLPWAGSPAGFNWDSTLLGPQPKLGSEHKDAKAKSKESGEEEEKGWQIASGLVHAASKGKVSGLLQCLLNKVNGLSILDASSKTAFFDSFKSCFLKHGDSNEKKAKAAFPKLTASAAKLKSISEKLSLPTPSVVVNGRVHDWSHSPIASANDTIKVVKGAIAAEMDRFAEVARLGSLKKTDDKSIDAFVLTNKTIAAPPWLALSGTPSPRSLPELLQDLPLLQGSPNEEAVAVLFLEEEEDLSWLFPIATWSLADALPIRLVLHSELPYRECISALVARGEAKAVAAIGYLSSEHHFKSIDEICEAATESRSTAASTTTSSSSSTSDGASDGEGLLPLMLGVVRRGGGRGGGPKLQCGGRLWSLPKTVPGQVLTSFGQLGCLSKKQTAAKATSAQDTTWPAALEELSPSISVHFGNQEKKSFLPLEVRGLLDPLCEEAPRIVAAVEAFAELFGARGSLQLQLRSNLQGTPLNKFSRSALPRLGQGDHQMTTFKRLETSETLTMEVITPQDWCISAAKSSNVDLDNIRKVDVLRLGQDQMRVEFVLKSVYVEGSAKLNTQPLDGLQLELLQGDRSLGDTIVMKQNGYFALEGQFGEVHLRAKEGPSNDTVTLEEAFSASSALEKSKSDEVSLYLDSWLLPSVEARFKLRRSRKKKDLFNKSLKNLDDGGGKNDDRGREGEGEGGEAACTTTINVFSVASGFLYEKLLRIMMLSARKTTKCPLRFWFFDRFMSPDFKKSMPDFARSIDVSFEFVAFKWPSWLTDSNGAPFGIRGDKQRYIWAHKILFLDVIFPLNLRRIIFVDADMVVRSDLRELYEMDLEGAPYAFTPFCSEERKNEETTGFRFWDGGFWLGHLRGRPYHVSALFVVDLVEFRRLAAGDVLRETYFGLAGDPNSLSNLDQDLPNYAQFHVPIKALPEDWLWCESWCSAGSKEAAKAIDLCQNPKTKEPKIHMAKRIVAEWSQLDEEVASKVEASSSSSSSSSNQTTSPSSPREEL